MPTPKPKKIPLKTPPLPSSTNPRNPQNPPRIFTSSPPPHPRTDLLNPNKKPPPETTTTNPPPPPSSTLNPPTRSKSTDCSPGDMRFSDGLLLTTDWSLQAKSAKELMGGGDGEYKEIREDRDSLCYKEKKEGELGGDYISQGSGVEQINWLTADLEMKSSKTKI